MEAYGSAEARAAFWVQECVQSVDGVGKLMADGASPS